MYNTITDSKLPIKHTIKIKDKQIILRNCFDFYSELI